MKTRLRAIEKTLGLADACPCRTASPLHFTESDVWRPAHFDGGRCSLCGRLSPVVVSAVGPVTDIPRLVDMTIEVTA